MRLAATLAALVLSAATSAALSVRIRQGAAPWWLVYGPAAVSATVWARLVTGRASGVALPTAAVLFDVCAAVACLGTMWVMGCRLAGWQWVGAGVAVVGLGIMAAGGAAMGGE